MGLILLRYGEIALKGGNRTFFLRRLRRNVRACLKAHGIAGTVFSEGPRIYVRTDAPESAAPHLARVFGLVSASPVAEILRQGDDSASSVRALLQTSIATAREAHIGPGVTFRVRARRGDKSFPLTSPEIGRICGDAIRKETGGSVDLSDASDVTIGVEVRRERILVFGRIFPAPGGLPLGTQGRVVALLSGGIDSPVAAWLMMRRGCTVIPLHFAQSDAEAGKALDNVDALRRYSYGWSLRPVVLSHSETVLPTIEKLQALGHGRWTCVFCKRQIMLRACALAEEVGAHAIVMGDNLGQVASQTLPNLEAVSWGMPKPVLRPLLAYDKHEIVALAREIGTFDVSTRSESTCPFLPPHPITRAKMEDLISIRDDVEGT